MISTVAVGFDRLLDRMAKSKVAGKTDLLGCNSREINELEQRYGIELPLSYRRYLELMGHRSGRLFTSDHMAVFYSYVLEMTDEVRTRRISPGKELYAGDTRAPESFKLPPDAILIAGRLDAAWQFIRCTDGDDSPVWYFDENEWLIKQSDASVLDWLNCWCGIAEEAIKSGYFLQNPSGTTP